MNTRTLNYNFCLDDNVQHRHLCSRALGCTKYNIMNTRTLNYNFCLDDNVQHRHLCSRALGCTREN